MRTLGLLYLSLTLFVGTAFASGVPEAPAKAGGKRGFQTKHYGEGGGAFPVDTPDAGDYHENCARYGPCTGETPDTPGPIEDPAPPAETEPQDRGPGPVPDGWDPERGKPVAVGHGPVAVSRPVALRTGAPAATSPQQSSPGSAAPETGPGAGETAAQTGETLRDAPAGLRPGNYSLWAGLSQPLLLPPDKVHGVSPDRAKAMGHSDYDTHILGLRKSGQTMPLPSYGRRDAGLVSDPEKGQFVAIELDIANTPGVFRDAVAELADSAGFQMDERFSPVFRGSARKKVVVQGWLPPRNIRDAMASERVSRIESGKGRAVSPRGDAMTDLLLGIRVPNAGSPDAALRAAVERLASDVGFEFERAVAYQVIPGTDRMVLVVAGRVRIRDVGRLMADPDVVKIGPSPVAARAPAAPLERRSLKERLVSFVTIEHPFLFLVTVLLTVSLLGSLLGRREMGRRRSSKRPSPAQVFKRPRVSRLR